MVSARYVLALCVLLALAGCTGVLPGPGPTTDSPTTTTDYPPGLVSNGVSDPSALADATGDALSNRSAAYASSVRATRDDTLAAYRYITVRMTSGGDRYLSEQNVSGTVFGVPGSVHATTWANETTIASKFSRNGTTNYTAGNRPDYGGNPSLQRSRVHGLYLGLAFDVSRTNDGYTLTATDVRDPDAITGYFENVSNVTATVSLDSRGVVRSYRLEYDATARGDAVRVVETFAITQLGGVTVERPPWVEMALNESAGT